MASLPIASIHRDGGTQPRSSLDDLTVGRYAEEMRDGLWDWSKSPVTCFEDGESIWLADGFHRVAAAQEAGLVEVEADVRQGSLRDAILYSVGANAVHGLPRTGHDKRLAVARLLEDAEWGHWSDRAIARRCFVSPTFVSRMRALTVSVDSDRTYRTKHGNVATMDTAGIGKAKPPAESEPPAIETPQPVPPITTEPFGPLRLDHSLPGARATADRPLGADAAGDEAQTYLDRLREAARLAKTLNPGYREDALREHRRLRNLFLKFDRSLRALEQQVGAPGRNKTRDELLARRRTRPTLGRHTE